jgi:hypothetical protein
MGSKHEQGVYDVYWGVHCLKEIQPFDLLVPGFVGALYVSC